jgi:hypothetical protein
VNLTSDLSTKTADEHVVEGILRADSAGRAELYTKLFYIGGLTINEIRKRENLDPVEGGDRAFVPLNVQPLEQVGKEPAGAQTPSRAAETPRIDIAILDPEEVKREREAKARQEREKRERAAAAAAARDARSSASSTTSWRTSANGKRHKTSGSRGGAPGTTTSQRFEYGGRRWRP